MTDELYISEVFTAPGGFTSGIEGPSCDRAGNLYAVNYDRQGTIGRVTPNGDCDLFVELPAGSVGNAAESIGNAADQAAEKIAN